MRRAASALNRAESKLPGARARVARVHGRLAVRVSVGGTWTQARHVEALRDLLRAATA